MKTKFKIVAGILSIILVAYFCSSQVRNIVSSLWNQETFPLQAATLLVQDEWKAIVGLLLEMGWHLFNKNVPPTISPIDDETARKQRGSILRDAFFNNNDVSVKGNPTKAEDVIKSIQFSSYEEKNHCNLKEGIPEVEFYETLKEIADLTNLDIDLKRVVQRARNFTGGDRLAVNNLKFKTKNGSMVFGRIAVLRNGDKIYMAYSLQSVTFRLANKQSKLENAKNFIRFSETLNKANDDYDEGDKDGADGFSFDFKQNLSAFFHKQAIDGFLKHCSHLLRRLDNEKKEEL